MMKKSLAVLLLWFPFSLAAIVAPSLLLYGLLTEQESIWKPVGRAMDKLLATLLGFSGDYTLSAELGKGDATRNRYGYSYQWLRTLLDMVEKEHCLKAAKSEGLI